MELSEALGARLSQFGVAVAYLFGSRARGDAQPASDADVAVLLHSGVGRLSLRERGALVTALSSALHQPDVDLVVLDEAPLELRGRVVAEGRVLFTADEPRRVQFEVETQSRWLDLAPSLRQQDHAYLARVAREGL